MANPAQLLLLYFLYNRYLKKFEKDPANRGKKPKGCFLWLLGFIFKLCLFLILFGVIILLLSHILMDL